MNTQLFRSLAFAAGLSLVAGAATAQTRVAPSNPSPAVSLGYSAAPAYGSGYAVRPQSDLTVMGMTGAVEPKYPEATGSIVRGQPGQWTGPLR